jgi:hypothetical protein
VLLLIIASLTWIVLAMVTNVLPSEGSWAARRLANTATALAVRLSGRDAWRATVRTAQDEGSAGILPAVGFLAAALAICCWARRVMLARLLRLGAVLWFAGAATAVFLGRLPVASDPQMRWGGGVIAVGLAAVMLAGLLDPKMTARPKPRVVNPPAAPRHSVTPADGGLAAHGSAVFGGTARLGPPPGLSAHGHAVSSGSARLGGLRLAAAGHAITSGSAG